MSTRLSMRLQAGAALLLALSACRPDAGTDPVGRVPVATLRPTLPADTVVEQSSRLLTITVVDGDGAPLGGRAVTWTSSDRAVLAPSADTSYSSGDAATLGTASMSFSAGAPGTVTLVARSERQSARVTVVVTPAPIRMVALAVAPAQFHAGDTVTVAAVPLKGTGWPALGRAVAFTVSPADVATISPTGTLRFLTPGAAEVRATADGVTGTLVVSASGWATREVAPRPRAIVLPAGESLALGALTFDMQGSQVTGRAIVWSSSDPAIVRVTADGVATMVAPGTATLRAQSGAAVAPVPVTVTAAETGAFALGVRFTATPDAKLERLMRQAAARWERVVTGALPAYRVDLDAGRCGRGSPAVHELLANLTVFVHLDTVDGVGNRLAWATPCLMRKDGTTVTQPVLGVLTLDRADLPAMLANPDSTLLLNLLTHEVGHVLGIGLDWHYFGLRAGENTADVSYVGAGGRQAAYDLGFTSDPADAVLVENLGGGSTRNMHWREATFGDELMTGWVSRGRAPLSLVTVRSLADLGYTVQAAGADAFSVVDTQAWPSIAGFPSASLVRDAAPATPLDADVVAPRYTVTRSGVLEPIVR